MGVFAVLEIWEQLKKGNKVQSEYIVQISLNVKATKGNKMQLLLS